MSNGVQKKKTNHTKKYKLPQHLKTKKPTRNRLSATKEIWKTNIDSKWPPPKKGPQTSSLKTTGFKTKTEWSPHELKTTTDTKPPDTKLQERERLKTTKLRDLKTKQTNKQKDTRLKKNPKTWRDAKLPWPDSKPPQRDAKLPEAQNGQKMLNLYRNLKLTHNATSLQSLWVCVCVQDYTETPETKHSKPSVTFYSSETFL